MYKTIEYESSKLKNVFANEEEEKLYGEATTTQYEKVLRILNNIKFHLEDLSFNKKLIDDLQWVIKKIQTHTLYTYDLNEQSFVDNDNVSMVDAHEMKSFLEYLNDFSENKEFQRRNNKMSKTTTLKTKDKEKLKSMFSKRNNSLTVSKIEEMKAIMVLEEIPKEDDGLDLRMVGEITFNIFDFEEEVGRRNVVPLIAKYSFNTTSTLEYLNTSCLDLFLEAIQNGYRDVPYHNCLHAADVCQTMLVILTLSNSIEVLHLSFLDVIALLVGSLSHDIGHPSTNNTFQINSLSDFAITYNDKSVLENFHIAETFRIIREEKTNIFSKFDKSQFRHVRKRMIELILATDMMYHARTLSLVKNKLVMNEISQGANIHSLINTDSPTQFDEQQEVLNFMIHTCDIGHSAKPFEMSYKWTYCLMNEFWNQGDTERKSGLPISFLCDRQTADVPKNQIVFIKGILMPDFEILVEMFPSLIHFKNNLENNIQCWSNVMEEDKKIEKK